MPENARRVRARPTRRSPWPALALVAAGALLGCSEDAPEPTPPKVKEAAAPASRLFLDATEASGLTFQHFNGATGELLLPEITGSGGALFDAEGDGDLDLYLVQGAAFRAGRPETLIAWDGAWPPRDRLFRNDLGANDANGADGADGARGLPRFTDITAASGLDATGYGMGVATGDVDNDGDVDLFVTNLGADQLFLNDGRAHFHDATAAAGLGDPRWSTSAAFLDVDLDGFLDLFVASYVDFRLEDTPSCFAKSSAPDYCGPDAYAPLSDRLYRNRGDGSFEDISAPSGLLEVAAAGLGVLTADFDGDGRSDIYVANDGDPNGLWLWRDGRLHDDALMAGLAVNHAGRPEASMGVAAADLDGDGRDELFMTHLEGESNTLYWNLGDGLFEDHTIRSGLHAPSLAYTSFGTGFLDVDGDGQLDLLALNGAVRRLEAQVLAGEPYPLRQLDQLFRNQGAGQFEALAAEEVPALTDTGVGRGAVFGDVDNDGALDLVVCNNNGAARLLLNRGGVDARWLGARLIDPSTGRDALGAHVEVLMPDGSSLWRTARRDGSYCSARDPRVLVRLGAETPRGVRVHWPDGSVEERSDVVLDAYQTWVRGELGAEAGR